jgi:4-amino-4-deoxy-L-arabinose transferase-like glycosyltransferase
MNQTTANRVDHAALPVAERTSATFGVLTRLRSAPWLPLAVLVAVAFALRLWLVSFTPLDPRFSNADDGDYYQRALRLAVTGQYIDDAWLIRPPLHVFFFAAWLRLALVLGVPQHGVLFVQIAQSVVAALAVMLGYGAARQLFGSTRAGLLFATFLAVWFPFVEATTVLFTELLYLFLFLLHLWLLLRFDASGQLRYLALAGFALGAAALTRSPALYAAAFVVGWLFVRSWTRDEGRGTRDEGQRARRMLLVVQQSAVVLLCCFAVVGPWTLRNYLVYGHLIPVDTLGQINLWLDLDRVSDRVENIETLRELPQSERHLYALARAREILAEDPWRPFRPMWDTFRHIWKAQYIEDYYVKQSFFTRPLRETAPLGLAGDALWLVAVVSGIWGLTGRVREGWHNRLFFGAWVGYSLLTVLIFHVEPRYLLPLWTLLALYGAGALARLSIADLRLTIANLRLTIADLRLSTKQSVGQSSIHNRQSTIVNPQSSIHNRLSTIVSPQSSIHNRQSNIVSPQSSIHNRQSTILQLSLVLLFLALFFSYRDYPAIIATGMARERAMTAGERAYSAGDYAGAEAEFRAALAAQPRFVDAQVSLALALAAQGRPDEGMTVIERNSSRRTELVYGALARQQGDDETARVLLPRIEAIAGEDIQHWALTWLRPAPMRVLMLGDGLDIGYLEGFSPGERDATSSFRWLESDGRIVLPLDAPLEPGAVVELRLASGRATTTPLAVRIGDGPVVQLAVSGGQWRVYRVPVPAEQSGATRVEIHLSAPTFVPAREQPGSGDARALSLMVSEVRVQ